MLNGLRKEGSHVPEQEQSHLPLCQKGLSRGAVAVPSGVTTQKHTALQLQYLALQPSTSRMEMPLGATKGCFPHRKLSCLPFDRSCGSQKKATPKQDGPLLFFDFLHFGSLTQRLPCCSSTPWLGERLAQAGHAPGGAPGTAAGGLVSQTGNEPSARCAAAVFPPLTPKKSSTALVYGLKKVGRRCLRVWVALLPSQPKNSVLSCALILHIRSRVEWISFGFG